MRQFARPFPLERLSLEARALYTAFLVFLAAGIGSSVWLYASSFGGLGAGGAATHYLGSDGEPVGGMAAGGADAAGAGRADAGGPALDLPDGPGGPALDLPAGTQRAADDGGPALDLPAAALDLPAAPASGGTLELGQSPRQVMETFHFHLFTVPVVLLIVGHLFMLTSLGTRKKIAIIAVASVATFVHLVAPLLVRFGGAGYSVLVPASVVVAALGWMPMVLLPLWEMWRRLPAKVASEAR